MINPIVTFQAQSAPYNVVSSLFYEQSTLGGNFLPVKEGENSDVLYFRIYNNFVGSVNVATMSNISITAYDGAGAGSHTAKQSCISQSWIKLYENGFGESTISPGAYTSYVDDDTAIGRSGIDSYTPPYGSDGGSTPYIRAGTNGNGVGFIEFATYAQIPSGAGFQNYTLAIGISYDWVA